MSGRLGEGLKNLRSLVRCDIPFRLCRHFLSRACRFVPARLPTRPRRLARPRTPAFHADNTGSNPVGDAKFTKLETTREKVSGKVPVFCWISSRFGRSTWALKQRVAVIPNILSVVLLNHRDTGSSLLGNPLLITAQCQNSISTC